MRVNNIEAYRIVFLEDALGNPASGETYQQARPLF